MLLVLQFKGRDCYVVVLCTDTMWLTKTFRENRPFCIMQLTYTLLSDW
jgi:hypothetical protein